MKVNFRSLPLPARMAVGAAGGFVVGGAAVLLTGAVAGFHPSAAAAPAPSPTAVAAPAPTTNASPNPAGAGTATRVLTAAVMQAEAQALGMQQRDLEMQLRKGATVSQLAATKGLSQDAFRATLIQDLTPILGQDVSSGQLTSTQEQAYMKHLQTGPIPNWSQVGHGQMPAGPPASPAAH